MAGKRKPVCGARADKAEASWATASPGTSPRDPWVSCAFHPLSEHARSRKETDMGGTPNCALDTNPQAWCNSAGKRLARGRSPGRDDFSERGQISLDPC